VLELALGQAEFQIQDLEAKCPGVQRTVQIQAGGPV
jgi:hypothetical protein